MAFCPAAEDFSNGKTQENQESRKEGLYFGLHLKCVEERVESIQLIYHLSGAAAYISRI